MNSALPSSSSRSFLSKGDNYRSWLHAELENRKTENPAYSLRAFARHLGLSPTSLSQVINGKRKLTVLSAERIAASLGLSPRDQDLFIQSTFKKHLENSTSDSERERPLDVDSFRAIADWYHYAILTLVKLNGRRIYPEYLADRLGINRLEAKQALERLQRLRLIERRGNTYIKTTAPLVVLSQNGEACLRIHHNQVLRRASQAVDNLPYEMRESVSTTLAFDPEYLDDAKEIIEDCRQRLLKLAGGSKPKRVFALSMHLFPLDRNPS
ncbi:MAG: TIGR02147 family protein [Deltaproteobacteria bacterium]|nr:TIGR02147 family protein [Deltaproteobacteria bacterium]